MKIKHTYTGASIKELIEKFRIGSSGFYEQDWYKSEVFYTEKMPPGEYEIIFDKTSINKTYSEQVVELEKDCYVSHPAIVIEAVLTHFKKTGERLLKDWYIHTSVLGSDDNRVYVGYFDDEGIYVNSYWIRYRVGGLGVSSARKLPLKSGIL